MGTPTIPDPSGTLLERDDELTLLRGAVDAAGDGGHVVLVAGEAGSGKTALVRHWLDGERDRARVLLGWCDDLATARAFAPLHDVAASAPELREALRSGAPGEVLDALVALLDDPLRPVVLVLEDVHWADDATLDAVRHVARRIASTRGVLVLTYRDDELGTGHPLVPVLGGLAGPDVHRVAPAPLSVDAITRMADGREVEPALVARRTGGNAFLVTALLSDPTTDVPASVRDVVLGCVARLDEDARRLVLALAEVPGTVELALVDRLADGPDALVAAEGIGLLVVDGDRCRFRHEIARLAVRDGAGHAHRRAAHRRVLDVLLDDVGWAPGDDPRDVAEPVRLAHFAAGAGDVEVLVHVGPHAAGTAHGNGAHGIADRLQRAVLDHVHRLDDTTRAAFERERAWTLYSLGRHDEARDAAEGAVAAADRLGEPRALVRALVTAARMAYMANDPSAGADHATAAVAAAALTDDAGMAAEASVARATHAALVGAPDAVALADDAVARSAAAGDGALESLARNYRGVALANGPVAMEEAVAELEAAVRLGREARDDEALARAVLNLLEALAFARSDDLAQWLAVARGMDDGTSAWDGFRAHVALVDAGDRLDRADWDGASQVLDRAREQGLVVGVVAVQWSLSRARLAVRRGEEDAEARVAAARAVVADAAAGQFAGLLLALELEHAWLHDVDVDVGRVVGELARVPPGSAWAGELATACRRVGVPDAALPPVRGGPWAAAAAGDLAAAPDALLAAGLPHDAGLALVEAGGETHLRAAVELLDRLGAGPGAALARRRLADLGVASVPRGPSRATRANPAGLTRRQAEVLALLVEGCSNAAIAERLTVSVRTAEDHVSAVLAKLEVGTREEAATRGRDLLGGGG